MEGHSIGTGSHGWGSLLLTGFSTPPTACLYLLVLTFGTVLHSIASCKDNVFSGSVFIRKGKKEAFSVSSCAVRIRGVSHKPVLALSGLTSVKAYNHCSDPLLPSGWHTLLECAHHSNSRSRSLSGCSLASKKAGVPGPSSRATTPAHCRIFHFFMKSSVLCRALVYNPHWIRTEAIPSSPHPPAFTLLTLVNALVLSQFPPSLPSYKRKYPPAVIPREVHQ